MAAGLVDLKCGLGRVEHDSSLGARARVGTEELDGLFANPPGIADQVHRADEFKARCALLPPETIGERALLDLVLVHGERLDAATRFGPFLFDECTLRLRE